MNKVISGVLLPAGDIIEPSPVPVSDLGSLQDYVGGNIDAVRFTIDTSDFLSEISGEKFVLVGYVHDEGALIGLPLNKIATFLFEQLIFGNVVLVNGTNGAGIYDGENHDLPSWFETAVFDGSLVDTVVAVDDDADLLAQAIKRALTEGVINRDEMNILIDMMNNARNMSSEDVGFLKEWMDIIQAYHMARLAGMPPMPAGSNEEWNISDDEINKFLTEMGGN